MSGSSGNSFNNGISALDPTKKYSYSSQFFTPEPIDSTHQQFEASLEYVTKKFQVSGGYYGSFYQNHAGSGLSISPASTFGTVGDTAAGATLQTLSTNMSPLSLAPDNHMQQLFVNGAYNWSDDTRSTFSASQSFGVQNDAFIPGVLITPVTSKLCDVTPPVNTTNTACPSTVTSRLNLGGRVDTTNLGASLTSRITKEFSILASWYFEDRKDKTPLDNYLIDYGHGGHAYTNNPDSMKTNRGKVEANYRLPHGYRVTAGYDYDQKQYLGMAEEGYRDKIEEGTYRLSLRKSMSENLNGSVTLAHSDRTGSDWGSTPNNLGDHWIAPVQFSDRKRDKVKFMLDWEPIDRLNFQFSYEGSQDDYTTRINNMGLDSGRSELYTLDANYLIGDNWNINAWYSLGDNKIRQNERQNPRSVDSVTAENTQTCAGTSATLTCNPWTANLKLRSEALGVGVNGKLTAKLNIGARYMYSQDRNVYDIAIGAVQAGSNANSQVLYGAGSLPDTNYSVNTFQLFGRYALARSTAVRLDYIYDVRKMDDYTWSSWRYSDGTTVFVSPKQTTQILGLSLIQSF